MDADLIRASLRNTKVHFELHCADRFSKAADHLSKHPVDVVLLDLALPDCNGLDAIVQIRSRVPDKPIVVLTRVDDDAVAMESLKHGAQDYLIKGQVDGPLLGRSLLYAIERRRAEAQVAEAQQIAHVGSWEWNIVTDMVACSAEFYRVVGREPHELHSTYDGLLDCVHPDDRPMVASAFQAAVENSKGFSLEHRIVRPDGELRTVLTRGRVSAGTSSRPVRLAGTAQDITEQKRIHEHLLVSDRMASVGTLAAGVAHEINNPLAAVMANLEFFSAELSATQDLLRSVEGAKTFAVTKRQQEVPLVAILNDLKEPVDEARDALERVRQIVRDLKTFSRSDDEKRVPLDVRRVIESSLRMAWNEIRHRARLVKEYGDVTSLEANESRLGQVILNLIVNAAQAIQEGNSERNEIRIATKMDRGRVAIEIRDTGVGIPPENIPRIFDAFFTTKEMGIGTGLGLAISQRIVTLMGGEIAVESEVGRGTAFRVLLPPADPNAIPRRDGSTSDRRSASYQGRRGRVLVIDDELVVCRAIERIVSPEHDVMVTTVARQALTWIAEGRRFDAIVCDLMMPQMTGMEFYAELGRFAPDQVAKVIFVTGGAFTERARTFLDMVPNVRLEKPFERQQLRALINDRVR